MDIDKENIPQQEPRNTVPENELRHAIDIVCYRVIAKFRFGYHDLDDMRQQAYILALEVLATEKYDRGRPLTTFLYVHIHNRLYNFKRKHYARLTPPCVRCPLGAFCKGQPQSEATPIEGFGYCARFEDLNECQHYSAWQRRNNAKRSLMGVSDANAERVHPEENPVEMKDYLDWIQEQLPPEYLYIYKQYRAGKRVNREALAVVIMWIQDNILLTY